MSIRAYNKTTRKWASTEDGSDLSPSGNWVINPTFVPDEATCMRHGNEFWSFNGSTISTVSEEQWAATMRARAQNSKWREIQAERDRRKAGGVKVGDNWFHSDDSSRIQQIGLLLMGANMPPGIMWKTMAGSFVQMTPQLAQNIFMVTGAQDIQLFAIAEQKRAQMLQLESPCDYDSYSGWPPSFGE